MLEICRREMRFENRGCVKMRLRSGLRPGPRWGSLQRSPSPLAARAFVVLFTD